MALPVTFNKDRRTHFRRLILAAVMQASLAAATAWVVKYLFDTMVTGDGPHWGTPQILALLFLVTAAGALGMLRYRERVEAEALGQSYAHAVRMCLYDRLAAMPARELQTRSRGGHLLRFVGELTALRQWISLGLARLGTGLIIATISLSALAFINPLIALVIAAVIGIGALAALRMGTEMQNTARETRRCRARLAADVSERIALMPVVQAFCQVGRERGRLVRKSRSMRDAMLAKARAIGKLRGVTQALVSVAVALILAVGAYEVGAGRATPGVIVAALSVLGILMPALRDLSRVYEYLQSYRVAMERIRIYLEPSPTTTPRVDLPPLEQGPGAIELHNVAYGNSLRNITATAKAGTVVAIVGANGVGKSTLLSLIAGQLLPERGQVLIDGQDIRQCSDASLRATIGMVGPDLPLMRGTLQRNLRYRCRDASESELQQILDLCGIEEILETLPRGLMTRVAEGGLNLSSGQRQRIALARALLGQPPILLLDEADAELDSRSVRYLKRVLARHDGTVLMVSHRLEQARAADEIWHLADGEIIAAGPARQLVEQPGPTRRLLLQSLERVA